MKRIAAFGWVFTFCLALQAFAEAPATQPAPQPGVRLTIKVVDANTRQPLAGAKVSGYFDQTKASSHTNEDGVASLGYLLPVLGNHEGPKIP